MANASVPQVASEAVRRVGVVGGSLVVRVPRGWDLAEGDFVRLTRRGASIIIEMAGGSPR